MGRRDGLVYMRNSLGQLVRVQSEKKTRFKSKIDHEDIDILEQRKKYKTEPGNNKQKKTSQPPVKIIRGENPPEAKMVLDGSDRILLESGVTTPQEAYDKLGILLRQAEIRMQSILIKLEVVTFEEAIKKYKNRLPMKI